MGKPREDSPWISRSPLILSTQQFFRSVDPSRPYEPLGMSTRKWEELPVREFPLEDVTATQWEVSSNRVQHSMRNPYNADFGGLEEPLIVLHNGKVYLEDGHHRVVGEWHKGSRTVRARVLEVGGDAERASRSGGEEL